jgi:GT2 family glycosyltransferase
MKKKLGISIIIPNLNGENYISACLKSIDLAIESCPGPKFEVILVDNGSTDSSPDLFQADLAHPYSSIIINKKNLGFAAAVNQGIKKSQYSWVCLLNNDLVLDKLWFKNIVDQIKIRSKNTTTFCGTVFDRQGTFIESQGLKFYLSGKCKQRNHHQVYRPLKPFSVWGSSAAAVFYHKKTLKLINNFDPIFFAYIEDVDLSYRLHHLNYQTLCVPSSFSYHFGGGTSNQMDNFRAFYTTRNWWYFIFKNYPFSQIIKNIFPILKERLRNYFWFLRSTKFIFWLPHSLSITFQIIYRLPNLIKQNRRFQNLLKSNQT